MAERYSKVGTVKSIITVIGLMSIPTLVVRDKVKRIRKEQQEKNIMEKILKKTLKLEKTLNNKVVAEYIDFIYGLDIPNKSICKNMILNGYELIYNDKRIDNDLKERLEKLIYNKGIKIY